MQTSIPTPLPQLQPHTFPYQIESADLLIRVALPGEGQIFQQAVATSAATLQPWLGWTSPLPTLQESEQNCRRAFARYLLQEDLMVFFWRKADGALIGGSGLHRPDWQLRRFEIGYWGNSAHAGQGLMTQGVRALADYAQQEMQANRVFLTADDNNTRSWQLAAGRTGRLPA